MKKSTLLKLQIKKAFKVYPIIFLITVITLSTIAFAGYSTLKQFTGGENQKKFAIAVVGKVENTILEVGINAIRELDSSRFAIDVINMDEETAIEALKENKIKGYLLIPDGYVWNIMRGRNVPATFVTLGSSQTLSTILVNEVADIMSGLLTESQAAVYSMQSVLEDNGMAEKARKATDKLNFAYGTFVLGRDSLFDVETIGVKGLSSGGYYVGAFLLFFLLIMGVSFNKLLSEKNTPFSRMLNLSGVGAFPQVLCEHFAYLTLLTVTLLFFSVVAGGFLGNINTGIPELLGAGIPECIGFIILILPVVYMITMMQFMFYELSGNIVTSVLIQFLIAVGLGYVSGCFYPNSFFPEIIQNIASVLPSGVGFEYLRNALSETLTLANLGGVVVYSGIFTAISVLIRKKRIEGDAL